MKTMMRCLVLTLALVVYSFAEVRFVEIQNLDKFQSSRYKIITHKYEGNDYKLVFDTKEDDFEDLFVATQCPTGDALVFRYEYQNERALLPKIKYPDNILDSIAMISSNFCLVKMYERAKANQLTEADKEFIQKKEEAEIAQVGGSNNPNLLDKYKSNKYEFQYMFENSKGFFVFIEPDEAKTLGIKKEILPIFSDKKEDFIVGFQCSNGYSFDLNASNYTRKKWSTQDNDSTLFDFFRFAVKQCEKTKKLIK